MPIDDRTTNRNYKLPNAGNFLADDVTRLRDALTAIDSDLHNLTNGAPGALDTLDELAAALGDDANFAATVTTALGNRYTKTESDARYVQGVTQTENVFTGNGSQTTFTLTQTPPTKESLLVTVDGVVQPTSEYSLSGANLTLSEAPANSAKIRVLMLGVAGPVQSASTLNFTQAGTGAITRTVDSKLKDFVSVKDFGAVGDGVTDDTAAINAAINASAQVFIPSGTYRCNSSLNLKSYLHVWGIRGASVLRQYGQNLFVGASSMKECIVESLSLEYRKVSPSPFDCAFKLRSHTGCKFSNFQFTLYDQCTIFERFCQAGDTVNMVFNQYSDMDVSACNTLDVAAGYEAYQYVHTGNGSTTVISTDITWPEQFNSSVVVLKEDSRRIFAELALTSQYNVSYPSGKLVVTLSSPAATNEKIWIYPSCPVNGGRIPISNNSWERIRCSYIFSRGHLAVRWLDAETYTDEHLPLAQDYAACYELNPYTARGGQAGDYNTYSGCVLTWLPFMPGITNAATLQAFKLGPGSFNIVGDAVKCDLSWINGPFSTAIAVADKGTVALTGTVSTTLGSSIVTGSGTVFRNQLSLVGSVKDVVLINGLYYGIQSIDSDTQITLSTPVGATASGLTISKHNYSDIAGYDINFSSVGAGENNRRVAQTEGGQARSRSRTLDYGVFTISSGSTFTIVPHRVWRAFSVYEIQLTSLSLLDGRSISVSNITAANFRVNISSAAAANYTIGYRIELLPLNAFENPL
jgi:hypothetical protein